MASVEPCSAEDTRLDRHRLTFETLHVDDDLHLMTATVRPNGDAVQRRSLDDGAEAVTCGIERLTVESSKDDAVGARADLDTADHEGFDLVHVETLVDPGHEKHLRAVGLSANLPRLAWADRRGIGDEREHAERRLSERIRAGRTPGADPDVRLDFELFEAC